MNKVIKDSDNYIEDNTDITTISQMPVDFQLSHYKKLVDNSYDFLIIINYNNKAISVNTKALTKMGYTESEILGTEYLSHLPKSDLDKGANMLKQAQKDGSTCGKIHFVKKDKSLVPVLAFISYDAESKLYDIVANDISERLKMEKEIKDRNTQLSIQNTKVMNLVAEKDKFFRHVSHELRTPLTSVIGFSELMLEDSDEPLTNRQKSQVQKIVGNAHKLLAIVNDLLDLSKLESHQMTKDVSKINVPVFLNLLADNMRSLADTKSLELKVSVNDDIPIIKNDEKKIGQIVVNLLSNAIKFTDKGNVVVSAGTNNGTLTISVQDSGIGIAKKELENVFREFYQVKQPGTLQIGSGLGLAISKKLAEFLGAEISIESEPGKGSTFSLHIPICIKESDQYEPE